MATTYETQEINPSNLGWLFVQQYYTFLNESPERVHLFYNENSTFIHGTEGETIAPCHGKKQISQRLTEMDFNDCKIYVSHVDCQASMSGGLIVQVLGEMSNNAGAWHKFSQTFFLAEQPQGYYVLNDIFRFLKEDIEPDYVVEESEKQFTFQDAQSKEKKDKVEKVKVLTSNVEASGDAPTAAESHPVEKVQALKKKPEVEPQAGIATSPVKQSAPVAAAAPHSAPKKSAAPLAWSNIVKSAAEPVKPQTAKPTTPVQQKPAKELADGFKEISRSSKTEKKPDEKDKCTVYLRNVTENMDRKSIADAFEQIGPISAVDIPVGKKIAFVTFKTVEAAVLAIGKSVEIKGETVVAEERKRVGNRHDKKFQGQDMKNGGYQRNGRPNFKRQQQK